MFGENLRSHLRERHVKADLGWVPQTESPFPAEPIHGEKDLIPRVGREPSGQLIEAAGPPSGQDLNDCGLKISGLPHHSTLFNLADCDVLWSRVPFRRKIFHAVN